METITTLVRAGTRSRSLSPPSPLRGSVEHSTKKDGTGQTPDEARERE